MGHYPQVKDVVYHCSVWDEPLFIDRFHHEKITVEPIIANPILYSKSKLTDLIYLWNSGFSFTKLISSKLKNILEVKRKSGLQFIQCPIFKNDIRIIDYWLLNMYEFNMDAIDFSNSQCRVKLRKKEGGTQVETQNLSSLNDFNKAVDYYKEKNEFFYVDKIAIKSVFNEDFFMLKNVEGGIKYVVSENLKREIEDDGCTGIEFMPLELSLNEWLHGEREKVYGKG